MNTQNLGHPQDKHLGLSLRPPLLPPPRATGLGPSSMGSLENEGEAAFAFLGIRTIYYSSSKKPRHTRKLESESRSVSSHRAKEMHDETTAFQAVGPKSHQKSDTHHLGPCTADSMQSLWKSAQNSGETRAHSQRRRPRGAGDLHSPRAHPVGRSEQGARQKRFSADSMTRHSTCFHVKCTMTHCGYTGFA